MLRELLPIINFILISIMVVIGLMILTTVAHAIRHRARYYPPMFLDDGRIVGYKALYWDGKVWRSAQQDTPWYNDYVQADCDPRYSRIGGIYISKTIEGCLPYMDKRSSKIFLVSGEEPVVEHESGYRAMGSYKLKGV